MENQPQPTQNNSLSPGANMPVSQDDLQVVKPPVDTTKTTPTITPKPINQQIQQATGYAGQTQPYSYSQIQKRHNQKVKLLSYLFGLILVGLLVLAGLFVAPKLYKLFFNSPEQVFDRSINNALQQESVFSSTEISTSLGLYSISQDRQYDDGLNYKTSSNLKADLIVDQVSLSVSVMAIANQPDQTVQKINDISIKTTNRDIEYEKSVIVNKWLLVENQTFDNQGLIMGFFGPLAKQNKSLPIIPFIKASQDSKVAQAIKTNSPYLPSCSQISKSNLVECKVSLKRDRLAEIYSIIEPEAELDPDLWPSSFKLWLDTETELPAKLSYSSPQGRVEIDYKYDTGFKNYDLPLNPLSVEEFKPYAQQFEDSLN